VLKFDPSGNLLATFSPATEDRGTDWIDLAADQCTLFYTSEGLLVKRFDVCTNTQLTDFNTAPLPGSNAYAHRILPSGGLLVADTSVVVRLDASGNQIQTYTLPGSSVLFAINLDPDGTSFWTADLLSGEVFKVDIASGTVLTQWSGVAAGFTAAGGLAVKGEIIVGGSCIAASPSPIDFGNVYVNGTKKEVLTLTNNCTTKETIGAVSFTNVTGDPDAFTFHEYCNQPRGGGLKVGHSCTIAVVFTPDAVGTDTATLNVVTSAPGSPLQVPVTGAGITKK
jgi:hypothetical protein